jgi:hypothetical protein
MAESGYRSPREAAKARAEILETELRELNKIPLTELPKYPALATRDEKQKIVESLRKVTARRKLLPLVGLFAFLTIVRATFSRSSSPGVAIIALLAAVVLFVVSRIPGREERRLESQLRAIVRAEDESDRKFRVEIGPIQRRIDDEKAERDRLEQELEEARAMAEDNSANEKN